VENKAHPSRKEKGRQLRKALIALFAAAQRDLGCQCYHNILMPKLSLSFQLLVTTGCIELCIIRKFPEPLVTSLM
jgi:hypothetical protein